MDFEPLVWYCRVPGGERGLDYSGGESVRRLHVVRGRFPRGFGFAPDCYGPCLYRILRIILILYIHLVWANHFAHPIPFFGMGKMV